MTDWPPAWTVPCRRLGYTGCDQLRTLNRPPTFADLDCGRHGPPDPKEVRAQAAQALAWPDLPEPEKP